MPRRAETALALVRRIARFTKDGEEVDGDAFVMENDDAVDTLNRIISEAREIAGREEE